MWEVLRLSRDCVLCEKADNSSLQSQSFPTLPLMTDPATRRPSRSPWQQRQPRRIEWTVGRFDDLRPATGEICWYKTSAPKEGNPFFLPLSSCALWAGRTERHGDSAVMQHRDAAVTPVGCLLLLHQRYITQFSARESVAVPINGCGREANVQHRIMGNL